MAKAGLPIKKASTPVPVKIVHDDIQPKVNADYEAEERKRKARYALEDIERAEGHKRDKELMKEVKKVAREKISTMKKIC